FHSSDEHGAGSAPYIVLSYAYWHGHFQDDPGVVGRRAEVNKKPYTIIGVAPPEFRGTFLLLSPDFFVPMVSIEDEDALNRLAGLILLAACANLGSLFAARATDRSREVALRLALGAGRLRILRQLFTEALVISLTGGAVGIVGGMLLLRRLIAWNPFPQFPTNVPLNPDANVYAVAALLAFVSGILFGAVPVRQVLDTDPYEIVKSGSVTKLG